VPLARGDAAFQKADVRVTALALVALTAAIVHGWSQLVPAAIAVVGGAYAVELAVDDAPLDLAAPAVGVGLLLAAELAYWSLDERGRAPSDTGQSVRRAALVAGGGASALVLSSVVLALVDPFDASGLAVDVLGAFAAVAVVVTVVVTSRAQPSKGS
jgi:hypothetical protein